MTLGMQEILFLIIMYTVSFFIFFCIVKFMNLFLQRDLKLNFKKIFLYGFLIIFTILAAYVIISTSGRKQSTEFIPFKS